MTDAEAEADLTPIAAVVDDYRQAVAEKARWNKITSELAPILKEIMGKNKYGVIDGVRCLRRQTVTMTKVDIDRMREELPDIVQRYTVSYYQTRLQVIKE